MTEATGLDRRRFLERAAMTITAARLGVFGTAEAKDAKVTKAVRDFGAFRVPAASIVTSTPEAPRAGDRSRQESRLPAHNDDRDSGWVNRDCYRSFRVLHLRSGPRPFEFVRLARARFKIFRSAAAAD